MKYISKIAFVALCVLLSSCAWAQPNPLEGEIKTYFPDPNVQKAVRCIMEYKENFSSYCNIRPEILNYRNEDCECDIPVNVIEFFLFNGGGLYHDEPDLLYFSPQMMKAMIAAGADYGRIIKNIASVGSLQYFKALSESLEQPNGRTADGDYLLHYTVSYWDQEKIDYLRSRPGFDWELRDARGKTAILYGFTAGDNQISGFRRVLQMIDYGANPHARDYYGKGICDYVRRGWPVENRVFAKDREALSQKLLQSFQIDCNDPAVP